MKKIILLCLALITGSMHSKQGTPSASPCQNNEQCFSHLNPLYYMHPRIQEFFKPTLMLSSMHQAINTNDPTAVSAHLIDTKITNDQKKIYVFTAKQQVISKRQDIAREKQAQIQPSLIVDWGINSLLSSGLLYGIHKLVLHATAAIEPHIVGSLIANKTDLQPFLDTADYIKKSAIALAVIGVASLSAKYLNNIYNLHMLKIEEAAALKILDDISNYKIPSKEKKPHQSI